ncbi:hypothetical protein BAPAT_3378 [Bacillus anthracis str. SVA11]|nr:hypothetical protein BAPAT_3378 [Bacillus anthracis str. SVA11]EDR94722.1 hypothetical protein BAH_3592 [Bacillus anthracis str. A0442]
MVVPLMGLPLISAASVSVGAKHKKENVKAKNIFIKLFF